MKMLALIAALLLAASPVAAQQQQQPLGAGGRTNNSTHPNTRRYLPGTDDRDVLQRNHQPEQWRLWFRVPVPHRARLASPRLLRLFRPARRFRQPTNYATNGLIRNLPPQKGTPSKIRTQGSGYCLGTLGSSDPGTEGCRGMGSLPGWAYRLIDRHDLTRLHCGRQKIHQRSPPLASTRTWQSRVASSP